MKNHEWVDGKLLQTNKRYEQLKQKQKDKIMGWLYDAFQEKYREKNRMPDKRADEAQCNIGQVVDGQSFILKDVFSHAIK